MSTETDQDRKERAIDTAVSRALLFHFSPHGGTYGKDTIAPRIKRVIERGVTEEILLTLMTEVAKRAAEEADRTLGFALHSLFSQATKQAERSDSLSFHRYVETLQARIKERGEDTTEQQSIQAQIDLLRQQATAPLELPLDPEPWLGTHRRRFTDNLGGASGRVWYPRKGYEQDRSKYPEGVR